MTARPALHSVSVPLTRSQGHQGRPVSTVHYTAVQAVSADWRLSQLASHHC